MIDVVWFSEEVGTIQRGYWDQGFLEAFFDRTLWRPPAPLEFAHHMSFRELPADMEQDGAVVVVAGRWNVPHVERLQKGLDGLGWAVLVVTGDEEGVFPTEELEHPNLAVWVQTPRPSKHLPEWRTVGDFWPPEMPRLLAGTDPPDKDLSWVFAGQVNTASRSEMVRVLGKMDGGELMTTKVFGSGLAYPEYVDGLRRARVAPSPSGPFSPDTFRVFEALEAGCVPVVEASSPNYGEDGYWELIFGGKPPFPILHDWKALPDIVAEVDRMWPVMANGCGAWWQGYKRRLALQLEGDIRKLSGQMGHTATRDLVTVLVPTSPVPAHPSTADLEATVASVLAQEKLAGCEIVVMVDGLPETDADRASAYEEYRRRLLWLCDHHWQNVLPILHEDHLHQTGMTRLALDEVTTPLVLFVEHDTPIVGDISWDTLTAAIMADRVDLIRLHHEDQIQDEHRHLMLDELPSDMEGALLRTVQWSQRPHLASVGFYRRILRDSFAPDERMMIEDRMHSVVQSHWRDFGLGGWFRFRLAMYAPSGGLKRSTHLDSRGTDPKVVSA